MAETAPTGSQAKCYTGGALISLASLSGRVLAAPTGPCGRWSLLRTRRRRRATGRGTKRGIWQTRRRRGAKNVFLRIFLESNTDQNTRFFGRGRCVFRDFGPYSAFLCSAVLLAFLTARAMRRQIFMRTCHVVPPPPRAGDSPPALLSSPCASTPNGPAIRHAPQGRP